MIRISFENVGMGFGEKELFRSLSAEMRSGKITVVAGRNGSGKSTFLRLAAHLVLPDSGRVDAAEDGVSLGKGALRSRLAMVAPEMRLYDRLTAEENFRFFSGLREKAFSSVEICAFWDRVGLPEQEIRDVLSGQLSTGMRQRVKIALLLALDAPVWILDEPCANLDSDGAGRLMEEARRAASKGTLVLWATNESREEGIADETVRLSGN